MDKNNSLIIGIIALAIIGGLVYASLGDKGEVMSAKNDTDTEVMDKAGMDVKDETMMDKAEDSKEAMMKKEGEDMMGEEVEVMEEKEAMMEAGVYETYSADKIARAETGDVVLFFHASWCPSCRSLGANIEANLGSIPKGVSILKADYDKETELKSKYGVTSQHTLVQVDKDGNLIKKWSGSPSLDSLISQIQ